MLNQINQYLSNNSDLINLTQIEKDNLKKEGYVKLSRNKLFWDKHNINLDEFTDITEKLIIKEKKINIDKDKDKKKDLNTYKPETGANRVSNLIGKFDKFKKFISIPDILILVSQVLDDKYRISSIDIREPLPNHGDQGIHLDWNQRLNIDEKILQCSAFIYLDDVDENNGPLRVIPRSHNDLVNIKSISMYEDKRTPKDHEVIEFNDKNNSKKITAKKGDIVILNMCVFHGGTMNVSGKRRRTIFINYRSLTKRQQLNQYRYIDKKIHKNFSSIEKTLLHLFKPSAIDNIKRFLYDYRNNFIINYLNLFLVKIIKK